MKTTYSDTQMINATSGLPRIACYQDMKKNNLSRLTEQPFVTDNECNSECNIFLVTRLTMYITPSYIFLQSLAARSILRECMKPPVKLVSSG